MSDLIKVTGLWQNEKGTLSGSVGGMRVIVLPNRRKEPGSRQPDYDLFIAKAEPKEKREERHESAPNPFDPMTGEVADNELPF